MELLLLSAGFQLRSGHEGPGFLRGPLVADTDETDGTWMEFT